MYRCTVMGRTEELMLCSLLLSSVPFSSHSWWGYLLLLRAGLILLWLDCSWVFQTVSFCCLLCVPHLIRSAFYFSISLRSHLHTRKKQLFYSCTWRLFYIKLFLMVMLLVLVLILASRDTLLFLWCSHRDWNLTYALVWQRWVLGSTVLLGVGDVPARWECAGPSCFMLLWCPVSFQS